MGKQQFSSSLAQFNEDQLAEITANVQTVQTAVESLKNTDVAQLSEGIWKYKLATKMVGAKQLTTGITTTIFDVTGKGYFHAVAAGTISGGTAQVRITVDGVADTWQINASRSMVGYMPFGSSINDGGGSYAIANYGMLTYYADKVFSKTQQAHPIFEGDPRSFNTSIKMELLPSSATEFILLYNVGVLP